MPYELLGESYDSMINWPKRLAREIPVLERIFAGIGASLALDCGCGTGEHALAFARDGFDVLALDSSEEMIRIAENKAKGAARRPQFMCRSLDDLPNPYRLYHVGYDVVMCIGNTLPHVLNRHQVRKHFTLAAQFTRSGGIYVLQMLNYTRLAVGETENYPEKKLPGGGRVRRSQQRVSATRAKLVIVRVTEKGEYHTAEQPMFVWSPGEIRRTVSECGYHLRDIWADFDGSPFLPETSRDIVIIAEK